MQQILIAGDSTVTDRKSMGKYDCGLCYTGWGQMLPLYLGPGYKVVNFAQSGLTTETFRSEGHYKSLYSILNKKDFVLIQFGHNDQKLPHLQAVGTYSENLLRYVSEILDSRATPILVTPLARNSWRGDNGTYNDLLADYAHAVKEVGLKSGVSVIDLHKVSVEWIVSEGREAVKPYFYPGDFTHTNDYGAYKIAGFVAEQLRHIVEWRNPDSKWYSPPPSKIPREMFDPPQEILTKSEALKIGAKLCSYFAKNDSTQDEPEEVKIAKQNGFLVFEKDLGDPVTEKEFMKCLRLAILGRENLSEDILSLCIADKASLTKGKALEYIIEYEKKMGYQISESAIQIAGS